MSEEKKEKKDVKDDSDKKLDYCVTVIRKMKDTLERQFGVNIDRDGKIGSKFGIGAGIVLLALLASSVQAGEYIKFSDNDYWSNEGGGIVSSGAVKSASLTIIGNATVGGNAVVSGTVVQAGAGTYSNALNKFHGSNYTVTANGSIIGQTATLTVSNITANGTLTVGAIAAATEVNSLIVSNPLMEVRASNVVLRGQSAVVGDLSIGEVFITGGLATNCGSAGYTVTFNPAGSGFISATAVWGDNNAAVHAALSAGVTSAVVWISDYSSTGMKIKTDLAIADATNIYWTAILQR